MLIIMYLLSRLTEKSTWFGITAILSAGGVTLAPELTNTIIAAGTGVAGLIGALTSDNK